ncbi:MAG: hypothetical protein WD772_07650, partial [Pseudohongiellaceae bacterium]
TGGMRGRIKEIMTLSEARQKHARQLLIELDGTGLGSNFATHLAELLMPYRSMSQAEAAVDRVPGAIPGAVAAPTQEVPNISKPAGCRVLIQYQRAASKGCIMLGHEWRIRLHEDLMQRLKAEYGKDRVTVQYH